MADRSDIVERILQALLKDEQPLASRIARDQWPFAPIRSQARQYTPLQSMRLFIRDGFIDRYSGQRLVFPGALRLLSLKLSHEFPFQKNWKMQETHVVFWELFPTLDHIVPVARGGADQESNWVTTSMLRNSAKSNWMLSELGWILHPPGRLDEWDGMLRLFTEFVERESSLLNDPYLKRWHNSALKAVGPA